MEKKEESAEHCHSAKSRSKMRENRSIKSNNNMQGEDFCACEGMLWNKGLAKEWQVFGKEVGLT